mgnify:CR=1 FL=1
MACCMAERSSAGLGCVWAAGTEWITDPGTGSYTGDPDLRNRLRSTAAHATLQMGSRRGSPTCPACASELLV